jgi:phosphoribosylformimino-5-aminoimidazole carboxamide ribotide isomerase
MHLIPVIDLLGGVVVRGIAGQRSDYRPLVSRLTDSCEPLNVARALRDAFGLNRFYVADLDAILHLQPNQQVYRRLIEARFELMIDAGVRDVEGARAIRDAGAHPIVGLESCPSPDVLSQILSANAGDLTFSLDLQAGRPLLARGASGWEADSLQIVRQSIACGVPRIIVLDLADVGTGSGCRTDELCRTLHREFPRLHVTCGGGIRGVADIQRLAATGASAALVASALHDGRLTPRDLSFGDPQSSFGEQVTTRDDR